MSVKRGSPALVSSIQSTPVSEYSIRKVQLFDTPDGGGFSCELLGDGRLLAFCHDDGHGGEVMLQWHDKVARQEFNTFIDSLPRWGQDKNFPNGHAMDAGVYLSKLVDRYEAAADIRKDARRMAVFRVQGDDPGSYRTFPGSFEAKMREQTEKKYGAGKVVFANEDLTAFLDSLTGEVIPQPRLQRVRHEELSDGSLSRN